MESNKYTFPVLIDLLDDPSTGSRYGVEGIPTKFILDKDGYVAFEAVGFDGPGMEDELNLQIEILLNSPTSPD